MKMVYRITDKDKGCCFEEYSKETGKMKACGKMAVVKIGHQYVCREHLKHVISGDKKPEMYDLNGVQIPYANEFLAIVDGEKPKHQQKELFG
jgi:hypothetical protein